MQRKNELVKARVTADLKRELERHARWRNAPVSDIVRELIESHLASVANESREVAR